MCHVNRWILFCKSGNTRLAGVYSVINTYLRESYTMFSNKIKGSSRFFFHGILSSFFCFFIFAAHASSEIDRSFMEADAVEGDTEIKAVKMHKLKVRRHKSVVIKAKRVDKIFKHSTAILKKKNGPKDVACAVALKRSGKITKFIKGDGSIDGKKEYSELKNGVNVVKAINWCSGFGAGIVGCSTTPGKKIAVVKTNSIKLDGVLWAHEYGHNKGIVDKKRKKAIMNKHATKSNNRVTKAECKAFRK